MKNVKSDVYTFNNYQSRNYHNSDGGYGGYQNQYDKDYDLELLDKLTHEIMDEINHQLGNEITIADIKSTLTGIKRVIVNQLNKENSRKWKKWENEAMYQSTYYSNLNSIWNEQNWNRVKEEPITVTKSPVTVTTHVTRRPSKKLKWEVNITEEVATFIKKMMALNKGKEWAVAFTWLLDTKEKQIVIDRVYIMPVDTGGSHVEFVNESEYLIFSDISELGEFVKDIDNKSRFAGMMHSHHTMGSWHSSTDHNTIATYINDFNTVLSIVWSDSKQKDYVDHDIILESRKDSYTLDNVAFYNNMDVDSKELANLDNKWVNQYNEMISIVEKDYSKYKRLLSKFEDTYKFIKINELYTSMNNEDIKCDNIDVIKDLLK